MSDTSHINLRITDNVELPQSLSPGQEIKLVLTDHNALPFIGIIDVIHQNPSVKGKGEPIISWHEALEWGPTPMQSDDSWQKVATIKNHTKSTQDIIFRAFPLSQNRPK